MCLRFVYIYHTQFPCHVQKPFWMLNTTNVLLQINSIVFYSNGEHMLRVLYINNNKNTEINKKTMKKRNSKVTIESMNESRMSEVLQTTATAVSHRQLLWAATKTADAKLFYLVHFYGISSSPLPISTIRCMCERACMSMYVIVRLLWIHSKHLCEHEHCQNVHFYRSSFSVGCLVKRRSLSFNFCLFHSIFAFFLLCLFVPSK